MYPRLQQQPRNAKYNAQGNTSRCALNHVDPRSTARETALPRSSEARREAAATERDLAKAKERIASLEEKKAAVKNLSIGTFFHPSPVRNLEITLSSGNIHTMLS